MSIQRELTKLKGNLKYEKTAREGSAKRSATYELECVSLREERDVLLTEQKINRRRVEELSSTLNQERLKRLRDLHLNEVLRKQNAALEESIKLVGADTVSAHEKLLDKVLIADSAVAKSEVQRKIIDSQANEILEVTREVTTATERYKTAQNKIGEMEIALAKKTKEVLDFEAEIWRLRKEVTVLAGGSHSQKHVAFGRSYEPHTSFSLPSRRSRNEDELRSLTQDIQTKFGPDAITASCSISSSGSVFGQEKSAVTKQSRRENDVPESSLSLLSASLMRNLPSRSSSGPRKAGSPVAAMESYSPGNSSVFTSATPFSPSRHNRGGTSDSADVGDFMTKNSESKASIFVPKGTVCFNAPCTGYHQCYFIIVLLYSCFVRRRPTAGCTSGGRGYLQ